MGHPLNAATLIKRFGETYTITHRVKATIVDGIEVPGTTSTIQIVASIQPASPRELERLPQLRITSEVVRVYTATQLLTGGQGSANECDLITIDGAGWEVQSVGSWPAAVGYFKCYAQRPSP